jgi:hypothetical protein
MAIPTQMNAVEMFRRIQVVLESLFPEDWLKAPAARSHPARSDWEFCELLLRQGGSLSYPSQRRYLPKFCRLLLDTQTWLAIAPGSEPAQFRLGSIDGYGDEDVRRKIRSRIRNAGQYGHLLVELMIGGIHRSDGRTVIPYEQTGYPDLRVETPSGPLLIECKRLASLNENRLRTVIKDANRQIKTASDDLAGPFDGAVILDLNGYRPAEFGSSEWNPPHVDETLGLVQRALSGEKNRSIRSAYVLWDDCLFVGNEASRTVVGYRRRVEVVEHSGDARAANLSLEAFSGLTAASLVIWTPNAVRR